MAIVPAEINSRGCLPWIRRGTLILFVSGCLGLLFNALSPRGIPLMGAEPLREHMGLPRIGLPEAWELYQGRQGIFVDARSEEEYRSGHIPGALLLDRERFESGISAFQELVPPDTLLVTYCSGEECGSSSEVAQLLKGAGYRTLRVFSGGWEEWSEGGFPVDGENPQALGPARGQGRQEDSDASM